MMRPRPHFHVACSGNHNHHRSVQHQLLMCLGDYTVSLDKPLGLILEERGDDSSNGGVYVKEVTENGSAAAAAASTQIVPGDVLLRVNDQDVSKQDFDTVMDRLIVAPSPVTLVFGDGLGVLNMPQNVVRQLKTTADAYFIDAVVRQAVRTLRHDARLGQVQHVEVIIGAGVPKEGRGLVRFFATFTTDGGISSYSCQVSATGVARNKDDKNTDIQIVALSCAKDEGMGQTIDLINENQLQAKKGAE